MLSEPSNSTRTEAATAHSYTDMSVNKPCQFLPSSHVIVMRKQTFARRCDQNSRPSSVPRNIELFYCRVRTRFNSPGIRRRGVCCLLTYLLTCVLTYIHTYVLTYLRTYIHTYLRTYLLAYLHTYLLTYLVTCVLTYILTYLGTYLFTYLHTYLLTYLHT